MNTASLYTLLCMIIITNLSSFCPVRPVKSTLLDILLLRASGWKVEEEDTDEQETGSLSTEDEVFLETEDDVTEEQLQEETGDQNDSKGGVIRH